MERKDWMLGGASVAAALLLMLLMDVCSAAQGYVPADSAGWSVRICADGEVWGIWPLDQDGEVGVRTEEGWNKVCIRDGSVYMEEADCPDGYCVQQGCIQSGLDTIVCLPHKLVVEIVDRRVGQQEEGADVIAR